jgi:branched-chain amino acid transport system ATP-binding protein
MLVLNGLKVFFGKNGVLWILRELEELILQIETLSKSFGGIQAVDNVSFNVETNRIMAIIGPNGAGKTTLFNLITGFERPDAGQKKFKGKPFDNAKPHEITAIGISRTFQNLSIFDNLTVCQNIMVGRHTRSKGEFLRSGFGLFGNKKQEKAIRADAMRYLELVGLVDKAEEMAGNLPYGRQKLLETARALATEPELLLLDEPAAGLNEKETEDMADIIKRIQKMGVTILLVEHDMELVMNISDWILVLNYGVNIANGTPESIQENPLVIEAYLGEELDECIA